MGYAANDLVLIILWILAAIEETSYISGIVCFAAFLANDIYGFINWRKMEKDRVKTIDLKIYESVFFRNRSVGNLYFNDIEFFR